MRPPLRPPLRLPLRPPYLRPSWLLGSQARPAPRPYMPQRIATTSASSAAPTDLPPLVIRSGSSRHDSLPSFLAYAQRIGMTPEKTTFVGTHYEYTAALALERLGFSLLRTGRAHDAGIDLIGHWVLAPLREPLPVILQCKARKVSLVPSHVRELEGSFPGMPADWKHRDVLGLLVSTRKATRGILTALGQSRAPIGFVLVSREGLVEQFVWNRAASERGLEGIGVTVRHTPRALLDPTALELAPPAKRTRRGQKFNNTGTQRDIQLTWMGSPIFPAGRELDIESKKLMQLSVHSDDTLSGRRGRSDQRCTSKPGKCRYKMSAHAPKPRGGMVGNKVGRPKKSIVIMEDEGPSYQPWDFVTELANAPDLSGQPKRKVGRPKQLEMTTAQRLKIRAKELKIIAKLSAKLNKPKRGRGRPKGSKNIEAKAAMDDKPEGKPGTPKGSKNKAKAAMDENPREDEAGLGIEKQSKNDSK